jgi:hypothetical protein
VTSALSRTEVLPRVMVSPEVRAHVRAHGVEGPLERLVEATPRIYPSAVSIQVYLESDVEDEDLWFIVFEVRVPASDVPEHRVAQRSWIDEWMEAYPCPRTQHFVLSLEPVET